VWRFIDRCWTLYAEATAADRSSDGPGIRAVIAVGLRAKGSNRGIVAQDEEHARIIEDFAAGRINKKTALGEACKVRRVFDIVPQLQANFAFARAYSAEQDGSKGGLPGPNLYLDIVVFKQGVPSWIKASPAVPWPAKRPSMATSFIAVEEISEVAAQEAQSAFRNGYELLDRLRLHMP
jgi:hypothetical protein